MTMAPVLSARQERIVEILRATPSIGTAELAQRLAVSGETIRRDLQALSDNGIVQKFHGGVSLQECVIPELIVERGEAAVAASITEISWRGMRCRVAVETNVSGLKVDLRLNWKQAKTSIVAAPKELGSTGETSLAVSDDSHEGAAASVVVFDQTGRVLDNKPTTVGEET